MAAVAQAKRLVISRWGCSFSVLARAVSLASLVSHQLGVNTLKGVLF